jgi:hypothetical protein
MLVPSSFQRLPNAVGCHNGRPLFGGAVSQMASALAQLQRSKFLGEAHYQVEREVLSGRGGRTRVVAPGEIKSSQVYNFLYQSKAQTSHLCLLIQYTAVNFEFASSVSLSIELRDTAGNSYTGTVLDAGTRFTETELRGDANDIMEAFTGCDEVPAPSNIVPDPPRPLFVPVANRGEVLNIVVTGQQLIPLTVHIYDVFMPEVTA